MKTIIEFIAIVGGWVAIIFIVVAFVSFPIGLVYNYGWYGLGMGILMGWMIASCLYLDRRGKLQ